MKHRFSNATLAITLIAMGLGEEARDFPTLNDWLSYSFWSRQTLLTP